MAVAAITTRPNAWVPVLVIGFARRFAVVLAFIEGLSFH
jgi:hypothetical protein